MSVMIKNFEGEQEVFDFDEKLAQLKQLTEGLPVFESLISAFAAQFELARMVMLDYEEGLENYRLQDGADKDSFKEGLTDLLHMAGDVFKLGIRTPTELYALCRAVAAEHSETITLAVQL